MIEGWSFEAVEDRLVEAMGVLWRSGDRERAWLKGATLPIWREVVPEHREASPDDAALVSCALTRREVMRAEEAMGWVARWVPAGESRKVMGVVLSHLAGGGTGGRIDWTVIWRRMGGKAGGWTSEGLRKRYSRSVTVVAERLNANHFSGYAVSISI